MADRHHGGRWRRGRRVGNTPIVAGAIIIGAYYWRVDIIDISMRRKISRRTESWTSRFTIERIGNASFHRRHCFNIFRRQHNAAACYLRERMRHQAAGH